MTTWINPEAVDVPDNFRSIVGGHPVIADTLFRRGIRNPEEALSFLNPDLYKPSPSHDIPGMEKAVIRLMKAKEKGDVVCVWGDFDVDGQTSTALLVSALRRINISTIYHVPLRDRESHGVNIPLLKLIIGESNQPKINLLLTCDTGIASKEAINFAYQCGVVVIISVDDDIEIIGNHDGFSSLEFPGMFLLEPDISLADGAVNRSAGAIPQQQAPQYRQIFILNRKGKKFKRIQGIVVFIPDFQVQVGFPGAGFTGV
ncbi:MAG: DHH family phosphoesterase, partial [Anaerolineales bacterium]